MHVLICSMYSRKKSAGLKRRRDSPQYFGYMAVVIEKKKKVLSWFSCSGKKVHMVNTSNKGCSGRWELEEEQNQCLPGQAAAATFGLLHGRREFDSFPKTAWKLQAAEEGTPPWFSCFSLNAFHSVKCHQCHLSGNSWGKVRVWGLRLSDQGAPVAWDTWNFMQGWGTCSACCGHLSWKRKP